MSAYAAIKLIGRDRESGRTDAHGRSISTVSFSLNNGYVESNLDSYLLWIDQVPSSGISIWMKGMKLESVVGDKSQITNPLRLDWFLYAAGSCTMDDDPVWEGSTWIDPTKSENSRSGRLVQVTGLFASQWLLRVVMEDPGVQIQLIGSLEYQCPDQPVIGGPLIASGPFVG